ncbi:ComF family protein, partial [Candidatus Peregrinibacteria bacterium]|nr:ComF family protein [Candidatus Peregrinibacteria bacterium]
KDILQKRAYTIVPVPLHKKRLRFRGYNQAEILAKQLGDPQTNIMKRIKYSKPQMELSAEARKNNVKNAFACLEQNKNDNPVLLVDDVATTLSTLNECAKVLKSAGYKKVYAICLARSIIGT